MIGYRLEPKGGPERYGAAVTAVRLLGVGIAALLAVAGCATGAPTAGTPVPAPVASMAAGLPVPSGPPLGQSATANNGQVQATVFGYREPGKNGWAAADVQVCAVATGIFDVTVSQGPWLLLLSCGPGTPASPAPADALPQPGYPTGYQRLQPGKCVRGWIGFPVPAGARPVAVQYSPSGADPISWAVG
jgi:hypothetical protein